MLTWTFFWSCVLLLCFGSLFTIIYAKMLLVIIASCPQQMKSWCVSTGFIDDLISLSPSHEFSVSGICWWFSELNFFLLIEKSNLIRKQSPLFWCDLSMRYGKTNCPQKYIIWIPLCNDKRTQTKVCHWCIFLQRHF